MRIGLICGGPSEERGISLNSARSTMDHLTPLGWEVFPLYCDRECNFYKLEPKRLYSNTPSDFDFQLKKEEQLSLDELVKTCLEMDIILPVIHGAFGEDGELQDLLERHNIPFVGSDSKACRLMFDKVIAKRYMRAHGFLTLPDCCLDEDDNEKTKLHVVSDFFRLMHIEKVAIKPSAGGSSIGFETANNPEEAVKQANIIFKRKFGDKALIEPFCQGREFTVIVLQNQNNEPVALIPTEIDLHERKEGFRYRDKYLPSDSARYFCPPRFTDKEISQIQKSAEILFSFFGMRDFSRLDGWLLGDGSLIFSDFNPISGMEQNSFIFIQGSRIGLSHGEILSAIVMQAAKRYGISCTVIYSKQSSNVKKVKVLFGGETAERQVSLMSGTNVWLKLLHSKDYLPSPYLLTSNNQVWHLPYSFTLNHTVEEIVEHCKDANNIITRLKTLIPPLRQRLGLPLLSEDKWALPCYMTLEDFCMQTVNEEAFVFNALHGGCGENGRIQKLFNKFEIAYNGSDVEGSHLCMDKYKSGKKVQQLHDPFLISSPKIHIPQIDSKKAEKYWNKAITELKTDDIIIKPQSDGCSTGVVRLVSAQELKILFKGIEQGKKYLETEEIFHLNSRIELPVCVDSFILEPFIETIKIQLKDLKSNIDCPKGWIELTVGVLEENGYYHSLSPSITVKEDGNVLSLEEKFQGGTGVNLTPPPKKIINKEQIDIIKTKIELAARTLEIQGYARIDIFFNTETNVTMVIEANTLPGLTPSTVIYHQALAEKPSLFPKEFLSILIKSGIERWKHRRIHK